MSMKKGVAYTDHSASANGDSFSVTGLTSGRGVGVILYLQGNATVTSCTLGGNAMTVLTAKYNATYNWTVVIAWIATQGGGSQTLAFAFTSGNSNSYFIAQEIYDTVTGSIAFDAEAGTTGNGTNPSYTLTTNTNNTFILAGLSQNAALPTAGGAYLDIGSAGFYNFETAEYDEDAGASGGVTVNWTVASTQWVSAAAAFKASGGGGAATSNAKLVKTFKA